MRAWTIGGVVVRVIASCVVMFAAFRIAAAIHGTPPDHGEHRARYSMLALGDTGKRHRLLAHAFEGQLSVGADLIAEDRVHPVDALLLLGDNFYMRGLRRAELADRIRMNLVRPYCGFVSLSGPHSNAVAGACAGEARAAAMSTADARPILALLGNHDHLSPESPALQRDAIPQFIANWSLSTDVVVLRNLAAGIDLILLDVTRIENDEMASEHRDALVAALQRSRGPWRVMASHAGVAVGDDGGVPRDGDSRSRFADFVQEAIAEAGVSVQLLLAGHHHSLQAIVGTGVADATLHVIAGSGSRARALRASHPRALYARAGLGFARLDWVEGVDEQHLEVSLFESASWPVLQYGAARLSAQVVVGLDGRVRIVD